MAKKPRPPPVCQYCGQPATLMRSSAALYQGRDYGPAWTCLKPSCEAWVGCHPGGVRPLGMLANLQLRLARNAAHAAFDRLWKVKMRQGFTKAQARGAGYRWLADQLGIERKDCHIGAMDLAQCERVKVVCTPPFTTTRSKAA